jgi:AraC-like DNA-binding protein
MVNLEEDEFRYYKSADTKNVVRNSAAVLVGPHARSTIIDTHEQRWLAAIEFRSSGAAQFFSLPISELCNQVVSLDNLWGRDGALLRERLLESPNPHAKLRVLEELLLRFFTPVADPVVQYAASALHAGLPLSQVVSGTGLSPRTLQRRFSSQVGITPKRWARIRRLQKVLRAIRRSPRPIWHDLAIEYGYADQAHLVHEFRDLADITPAGYQPYSHAKGNHLTIPHD